MAEWDVTVSWTVEADSPVEAAENAWSNIRNSTGPITHVRPNGTTDDPIMVDLSEGVDGYG